MWLNDFKVAMLESNVDKLLQLIDNIPKFETIDELEEAKYLIANAYEDAHKEKNKTAKILQELKKSRSFLENSHDTKSYKLDLSS